MEELKSYKTREKLTIKEVNKVCNSKSEYFINNNSTLFTRIYLATILTTILLCVVLFATYSM